MAFTLGSKYQYEHLVCKLVENCSQSSPTALDAFHVLVANSTPWTSQIYWVHLHTPPPLSSVCFLLCVSIQCTQMRVLDSILNISEREMDSMTFMRNLFSWMGQAVRFID